VPKSIPFIFKIKLGNDTDKPFEVVQDYMQEQGLNDKEIHVRPPTDPQPQNIVKRPPQKLKQSGMYTGEWDIDTMHPKGYGELRYSSQFMNFYKKGQFDVYNSVTRIDKAKGGASDHTFKNRVALHGRGKQFYFENTYDNVVSAADGYFENGDPINGLLIYNTKIMFADPQTAGSDYEHRFNWGKDDKSIYR
jgi:hypothetical protein